MQGLNDLDQCGDNVALPLRHAHAADSATRRAGGLLPLGLGIVAALLPASLAVPA